MTAPRNALPPVLYVGPHRYSVVSDKAAIDSASVSLKAGLWGMTDHDQMKVIIDPSADIDRRRDTIVHEALHTLTNLTGIDKDLGSEDEEKVVNRLAPALLDFLRRNPKWLAYVLAP